MFYDTFLQLCKENGEKPTPVLKQLQLSPGNLGKWKNGATINSDVLIKLSEHFGVSIDFLLTGKKEIASGLTEDEMKVLAYYNRLTGEEKDYIKGEMVRLNMAAISNKSDVEFADELAT